jgi:hypothetical protein
MGRASLAFSALILSKCSKSVDHGRGAIGTGAGLEDGSMFYK